MIISNKKNWILIVFISLVQISVSRLNAQDINLKFNHLTTDNGLPQNSVYSIVKDKYGFMWFGTWGGLVRYDGYSIKVFRANENDTTALSDNIIKVIVTDPLHNIWVETGDKTYIYKYNYEYENFTRVLFKKAPVYVVKLLNKWKIKSFKTAHNKLFKWTSTSQGLMQINQSSGKQTLYLSNHNSPFSLSDDQINYMYLDDCENLWIGTQSGGVNYANIEIKPFSYYYADAIGSGLIDNIVRAISKDVKGRLWVGSEDKGITVIEPAKSGNRYSYLNKGKLIDSRIRSIYCDRLGYMWIGTKGGIDRFDLRTNRFRHYYPGVAGSIADPNVFSIIEDHGGNLWIGTFKGLAKYDRSNDRFICFKPSLTGGLKVKDIIEDHNHNLWVATEDGGLTKLYYSSNKKTFDLSKSVRYLHREGNENTIINNRISSLSEDKNGMIWIGTNAGISLLNPVTNKFKHFSIKSGLPDDLIMAIKYDGKKYVWISHKKGISRINIETFSLQNFNMYDGLQGTEFNQNASFYDRYIGEMYFGGTNGLNSFYPDSIKINRYKPRVVLTNLTVMDQIMQPGTKVNNRVVLQKSLLCTDEITLTWWEKAFSLEFSALHFANPQGNKYKYKLEGINKQWIFTDASTRSASYSYLPAGTYQFKVYAANSDGLWCDTPATLRIIILPPWWATWWAKTIYLVFACLAIGLIYKYIVSRIEIRKKEEAYQSKLRSLSETDTSVTKQFNTFTLRNHIGNLQDQRLYMCESFSKESGVELNKNAINISDETFLKKVILLIKDNLHDENFSIDSLAAKLKMSRSQFYRKIKTLTNQSLYDFVNTIRMNQALEYLLSGEYTVSEVAYKVGFSLPTNFTRAFVKFYGKTPSKYLDSLKNG